MVERKKLKKRKKKLLNKEDLLIGKSMEKYTKNSEQAKPMKRMKNSSRENFLNKVKIRYF